MSASYPCYEVTRFYLNKDGNEHLVGEIIVAVTPDQEQELTKLEVKILSALSAGRNQTDSKKNKNRKDYTNGNLRDGSGKQGRRRANRDNDHWRSLHLHLSVWPPNHTPLVTSHRVAEPTTTDSATSPFPLR